MANTMTCFLFLYFLVISAFTPSSARYYFFFKHFSKILVILSDTKVKIISSVAKTVHYSSVSIVSFLFSNRTPDI